MKLLYLQDFHLLFKAPINRKDNYYQSMLLKLDEILSIAKKNKVSYILDGGDFFESPLVSNTIVDEVLDKTEKNKIEWKMLFGNHCQIGHHLENSKGTSLAHMIRRSKFTHYLDTIEDDNCFIKGVEYQHNIEAKLKEEGIFHNKKDKLTIAIVHALVTEKPLPYSAMHVCYKDIKSNYDLLLIAHNHHPFDLQIKDTHVINIGACGRRKIDEQDISPSVLLIDTFTKKLEIIKLKSAKSGTKVFDLEKIEKNTQFESNIDLFISSLNSVKLQSLDLRGKIEEIAKETKVEKEILDEVIKRIGEQEDDN